MKHFFMLLAVMTISNRILFAQDKSNVNTEKKGGLISFESVSHDFGKLQYMADGSHVFVFTNTGSEPVIITNVIKGCGCTAVDWTREPIKPGGKGMVKATYDTKKIGVFNKGVDVYSNTATPKINLRLKGTVVGLPD